MLFVFGLGFSGAAIALRAGGLGVPVAGTVRDPARAELAPLEAAGVRVLAFDSAAVAEVLGEASALVVTAAPGQAGDPVLARWSEAILAAPGLRWIGYLSTTGVYGNRDGGWVDETTEPAPVEPRARARLAAEQAWRGLAGRKGVALDLIRLAGIYGPGRSVLDDLRAGHARHVVKPGHAFSRIHRDDIAAGVLAAWAHPPAQGTARVLNFADDVPAPSAEVVVEAARLLGIAPPPPVPFEVAVQTMSPMARSFWADNRRVSNAGTKAALGQGWLHPSYREGLAAILAEKGAEERAQGGAQQHQVGRP